jgi:hypothetical protein
VIKGNFTNQISATEITLSKIIDSFTLMAILISSLGLFGLAAFSAEQQLAGGVCLPDADWLVDACAGGCGGLIDRDGDGESAGGAGGAGESGKIFA